MAAVSADGSFRDEQDEGLELSYAVVVNQSSQVQQETALVFLLQLLYRQQRQAELLAAKAPISQIDYEMARQDERALEDIRDVVNPVSLGWQAAAELVRDRADQLNISLTVRYEVDPFPTFEQVVERVPFLRSAYNDLAPVREAIDKVVSLVGGEQPRIGAYGAAEPRDLAQQRTSAMHFREYVNHATRDAEVCGNGYLAFTEEEPLGFFNLRPDEVRSGGKSSARTWIVEGQPLLGSRVSHLAGIKQQNSPYGVSLLEVAMPMLRSARTLHEARQLAERAGSASLTKEQHLHVRGLIDLADRTDEDMRLRLGRMLWFAEKHLPDPEPHLYFRGFERM